MPATVINLKPGLDVNKYIKDARAAEIANAINIAHQKAGVTLNPPVNGNRLRFVNPDCFGKSGELTLTGFKAFDKASAKNIGTAITINSTLKEYISGMEKAIKQCLERDNGQLFRRFEYLI